MSILAITIHDNIPHSGAFGPDSVANISLFNPPPIRCLVFNLGQDDSFDVESEALNPIDNHHIEHLGSIPTIHLCRWFTLSAMLALVNIGKPSTSK